MASKIIVIGDVNGQLSEVFAKLAKLHTKQAFAFAILTGNLFADPATASDAQNEELVKLLRGGIEVTCPTYFALGNRTLPAIVTDKLNETQGELCPNLSILGRKVAIKTAEGVKLVAVGGAHASSVDQVMNAYDATYTDKDVDSLQEARDTDILITSDWPADVRDGSKIAYSGEAQAVVSSLSNLCATLKPRYHFTTSTSSFEREPFFHLEETPPPVTRFISLAPLNNPQKSKAMYAFSLEPSAPAQQRLEGCTASPFRPKRKRAAEDESSNGFRFANANGGSYEDRNYRGGGGKRRKQPPRQQECYLCLGRNDAETHMIASIGENVYMTICKGPLSTSSTFPALGHPMHMLIIPLSHSPTFAVMEEGDRETASKEMSRYREAIHSMIASKSTRGGDGEAELGAVTWEISKRNGVHLHWQILPVPVKLIENRLVEAAFDAEAENHGYPSKFVKKPAEIAQAEEGDYFKVSIWSESSQKEIVLSLDGIDRFDLQFGRRVLGKLLGLPQQRTMWKDCVQSQAEEEADASAFREMFKRYDFSLEDEG